MDADKAATAIQELIDERRVSVTDTETHCRIRDGDLQQLSHSIYIPREAWEGLRRFEQEYLRCYAASLQGTRAVLVGRSAGRVNGIWVLPHPQEEVELALPNGRPSAKKRQFPGHRYRYMALPPEHIVTRGRLRYTDPIRTAIDIARFFEFHHGLAAFDSLLAGLDSDRANQRWLEISAMMKQMGGTFGIERARHAFRHVTNLSESAAESHVRAILLKHGIEAEVQMIIGKYRVDLLIDGWLIIEVDGYGKFADKPHDKVMEQVKRENWLKSQRYEVYRIFTDQIWDERIWIAEIRAILEAGPRGPVRVPALRHSPRQKGAA